jgi:hypothetical protein
MKSVFEIEPTSKRGKLYRVTETFTDDEGCKLGEPRRIVSPNLNYDAAVRIRNQCEKEQAAKNEDPPAAQSDKTSDKK